MSRDLYVERSDPLLILMDIGLPLYNGYHWCQEIRKVSKVPRHVSFFTGSAIVCHGHQYGGATLSPSRLIKMSSTHLGPGLLRQLLREFWDRSKICCLQGSHPQSQVTNLMYQENK